MGVVLPSAAMLRELPGAAVLVLARLCELADPAGIVARTKRDIGHPLDMGDTSVHRAIAQLKQAGLIYVDSRREGNVYRLAHLRGGAGPVNNSSPAHAHASGRRGAPETGKTSPQSDLGQSDPDAIQRPRIPVRGGITRDGGFFLSPDASAGAIPPATSQLRDTSAGEEAPALGSRPGVQGSAGVHARPRQTSQSRDLIDLSGFSAPAVGSGVAGLGKAPPTDHQRAMDAWAALELAGVNDPARSALADHPGCTKELVAEHAARIAHDTRVLNKGGALAHRLAGRLGIVLPKANSAIKALDKAGELGALMNIAKLRAQRGNAGGSLRP